VSVAWRRRDPDDDGDILTYNMWQYYTAEGPDTATLEKTTITTLNVPFLGVLNSPIVVGDFLAAGVIKNILQELQYGEVAARQLSSAAARRCYEQCA